MVFEPNFDEQRFLVSDFIPRLLAFAQRYDDLFDKDVVSFMDEKLREQRYYDIRYFLNPCPSETTFAMQYDDFSKMSVEEFQNWKDYASKVSSIINEKKALYEELLTFYNGLIR